MPTSMRMTLFAQDPFAVSAAAVFALDLLLAQLGPDFVKKQEPPLLSAWADRPTGSAFAFERSVLSHRILSRLHGELWTAVLAPETASTAAGESANPTGAMRICESSVAWLRGRSRDPQAFRQVFEDDAMAPAGAPGS